MRWIAAPPQGYDCMQPSEENDVENRSAQPACDGGTRVHGAVRPGADRAGRHPGGHACAAGRDAGGTDRAPRRDASDTGRVARGDAGRAGGAAQGDAGGAGGAAQGDAGGAGGAWGRGRCASARTWRHWGRGSRSWSIAPTGWKPDCRRRSSPRPSPARGPIVPGPDRRLRGRGDRARPVARRARTRGLRRPPVGASASRTPSSPAGGPDRRPSDRTHRPHGRRRGLRRRGRQPRRRGVPARLRRRGFGPAGGAGGADRAAPAGLLRVEHLRLRRARRRVDRRDGAARAARLRGREPRGGRAADARESDPRHRGALRRHLRPPAAAG